MITVRKYMDVDGAVPFDDWMASLRDRRGAMRIAARIRRLTLGLEGDWKSVGDGVRELRIPEGPGYRVYYAWDGATVVLLLVGGDKSTQNSDITAAKRYWRQYHAQ